MTNSRDSLVGDKSTFGIALDYPNDLWDIYAGYKRIGDAFDPSLGFVPRKGVNMYRLVVDYMPRPEIKIIRQFFFESSSIPATLPLISLTFSSPSTLVRKSSYLP